MTEGTGAGPRPEVQVKEVQPGLLRRTVGELQKLGYDNVALTALATTVCVTQAVVPDATPIEPIIEIGSGILAASGAVRMIRRTEHYQRVKEALRETGLRILERTTDRAREVFQRVTGRIKAPIQEWVRERLDWVDQDPRRYFAGSTGIGALMVVGGEVFDEHFLSVLGGGLFTTGVVGLAADLETQRQLRQTERRAVAAWLTRSGLARVAGAFRVVVNRDFGIGSGDGGGESND